MKVLYSTKEVADILHLSRVEVFRKIKAGKIKAEKIGRNFVVHQKDLVEILGKTLGENKKANIKEVVERVLREYEEAFRKLSKE